MKWHQTYKAQIGNDKILTLQIDAENPPDKEFIDIFHEAAKRKPKTIQEFFNTIHELQQRPAQEEQISIQLKKLKIYDRLSEETIAFAADLYINNVKAGVTNNSGKGGNTVYIPLNKTGRLLIKQAESWCAAQPPEILKDVPTKGHEITIPQSLENYIDTIVSNYQKEKDIKDLERKLAKHAEYNIVYGIPGKYYYRCQMPLPIKDMLAEPKGKAALSEAIEKLLLPKLKDDEKILNTNLPDDMIPAERKRIPTTLTPLSSNHKKGKSI